MTPKLSVVVHVDVDGRRVRVAVTGRLTAVNQQGLHPVLEQARTVFPEVTADLSATDCPDPHAVAQLRRALDDAAGSSRPVTILTASMLPQHPGEPTTLALHRDRRAAAPACRRHDSSHPGPGSASRCPLVPRPVQAGCSQKMGRASEGQPVSISVSTALAKMLRGATLDFGPCTGRQRFAWTRIPALRTPSCTCLRSSGAPAGERSPCLDENNVTFNDL